MAEERVQRRLAAILAVDVFSRFHVDPSTIQHRDTGLQIFTISSLRAHPQHTFA
jgi:hypothetical protein